MFKKKQKQAASPASQDVTVINKGTVIDGEVRVDGTIRIYGQLNGTVRSEGKVIVAEGGRLAGELYATTAEISGAVEGVITASRLDLRSTATVEGNVVVETFTTETGAIFIGDCQMPQNGRSLAEAMEAPAEEAAPANEEDGAPADDADATQPPPADGMSEAPPRDGATEPAEPVYEQDGVKPLPKKPSPSNGDGAPVEEEPATADSQGGRPRFW